MEEQQSGSLSHTLPRNAREKSLEDQGRQRELQGLEMQRERILSERTSNPHRRAALEAALADIEGKIAKLS